MPRWIPIDRDDLAQERALAELEGRCPKQAQRAFIRQEHRFYDIIRPIWDETQACDVPLVPIRPNRSPEGIERRRARSREWWRVNGESYRERRKAEGRPLKGGRQYRQITREASATLTRQSG